MSVWENKVISMNGEKLMKYKFELVKYYSFKFCFFRFLGFTFDNDNFYAILKRVNFELSSGISCSILSNILPRQYCPN